MKSMMTARIPILSWFLLIMIVWVTGASPTSAQSRNQFDFLLRFHPQVSTSMVVTGPEHVERVKMHSLVFRPKQTRKVLPELDKVLTKHKGWERHVAQAGEYVVYRREGTSVSYMSARAYRQLNSDVSTKLLPTKKGGCVVEYFHVHLDK